MRVWTDGRTHVLLARGALTVMDGKKTAPSRLPAGAAAPEILAIGPSREWTCVAPIGGAAAHVAPSGGAPGPLEIPACFELVALDAERLLAVQPGKASVAVIDVATGAARALTLPRPIKAAWREPLVWAKGHTPYNRKSQLGAASRGVRAARSEHGVAVADAESGIVVVVRPGAAEIDFALRFPSSPAGGDLHAVATREGVVAAVVSEGGEAALVHSAADGTCLGVCSEIDGIRCHSLGPLAITGDREVVVTSESGERLFSLDLPALDGSRVAYRFGGATAAGREQGIAASPDGDSVLVGVGARAWLLVRDGDAEGGWRGEEIALDAAPASSTEKSAARPVAKSPAGRAIIKGPPVLMLVPRRDAPPTWGAAPGEAFTVGLQFRNQGGAAQGVYVEVSGPPVADKSVAALEVRVGEDRVAFQATPSGTLRAELPSLVLPAATEPGPAAPRNAPPEGPTMLADIELRADAGCAGLLAIRMGPLAARAPQGSLLHAKRVEVR